MRMLGKIGWIVPVCIFVFVAMALSYRGRRDKVQSGVISVVEETNLAGLKVKLASLRGKVVLVNLWATW